NHVDWTRTSYRVHVVQPDAGTLRGLHYEAAPSDGPKSSVAHKALFRRHHRSAARLDDVRQILSVTLSAANRRILDVPPRFAQVSNLGGQLRAPSSTSAGTAAKPAAGRVEARSTERNRAWRRATQLCVEQRRQSQTGRRRTRARSPRV